MTNIDKETQEFINSNNRFIYEGDPPQNFVRSRVEGISTFGVPNAKVNIRKVKDKNALMYPGKLVFDATYTFNDEGLRNTTITPGNKDKVALFFGDAQMFGEGLNDNETLAYYFESYNSTYRSENYAFLGHGPSHMLYTVNTEKFKIKYKDKKGKAFFLLRDDAIKTTVGEIPWGEGYPKYEIQNGRLIYSGSFGGDTYKPDSMYLPSMFTDSDFTTTVEVFKEIQNNLPSDIELTVVIIPLTFSHYKIQNLLENIDIKVINLYYTDLEYYTNKSARFLDGVHTQYANDVLAKRITDFINNNLQNYSLDLRPLLNKQDVYNRLKFETLFIPCMVDFPDDDAGVIISNTLKEYRGEEILNTTELMEYMKAVHLKKIELVANIENIDYINNDLLDSNLALQLFKKEYIDLKNKLSDYVITN